ncbi:MAG: LysE family translocator [Rhodospirillaceae bacterium]|nr:LysE family translocator [Rhodospirillaceae bacterium]
MTLASTLAFALAMLVFALSPGPGVVAVVSCALGRGLAAALAMSAGMVLGDVAFLCVAAFGLSLAAEAMGELFLAVKFAGAGYLIWLGVAAWRAPPIAPAARPDVSRGGLVRAFTAGFFISLGNPKVIAFYVGFLPTFLDLARMTAADVAVIAAVVLAVGFAVMAGYSLAAVRASGWIADGRGLGLANKAAGAVLIGAGVVLAVRG